MPVLLRIKLIESEDKNQPDMVSIVNTNALDDTLLLEFDKPRFHNCMNQGMQFILTNNIPIVCYGYDTVAAESWVAISDHQLKISKYSK